MSVILQMTAPVVDMIYKVRALPVSGQEEAAESFAMEVGGGFNAMAAARAAGADVRLGRRLGTGPLSDTVATRLDERGIGTMEGRLPGLDQGCCVVLLEPGGERSFVSYPGAEGTIRPADLAGLDLPDVSHVLLSGYVLHYDRARDALAPWIAALSRNITVVFDPSPVAHLIPSGVLAQVMARADWISANEDEARHLTGRADAPAAALALAAGRRGGALLRQGAAGCLLATDGALERVPPHRVAPVDTNGAGDCHIGSFLARLIAGDAPVAAARYANAAAALSTTRFGPATAPARHEVEAILKTQANDTQNGYITPNKEEIE